MQPTRRAKPHAGTPCVACGPNGPGHSLCQSDGCDALAETQTQRHATQSEYDAIPPGMRPVDGYATISVLACADCAPPRFGSFCEHPAPEPVPCPTCHAVGDTPCAGRNGGPRAMEHPERIAAQPGPGVCTHAHREDCPIFEGCQCSSDDEAPTRTARGASPAVGPDISGLTVPVHIAQMVLNQAGHAWAAVIRAYSLQTQDNRPAIGADVHVYESGHLQYDAHGHPLTQNVVVPIPLAPPGHLLNPAAIANQIRPPIANPGTAP